MYHVHGLNDNIVKMSVIPKFVYRFNAAISKNTSSLFFLDKNWQADPKIYIKMQKPIIVKFFFEEEQSCKIYNIWF